MLKKLLPAILLSVASLPAAADTCSELNMEAGFVVLPHAIAVSNAFGVSVDDAARGIGEALVDPDSLNAIASGLDYADGKALLMAREELLEVLIRVLSAGCF